MPSQQRKTKQDNPYKATAWAREIITDLEVPSGQLCQVRVPGVQGLIKAGLIDSLDSLTALVKTDHIDRMKTGEPTTITAEDMAALAQNAEAVQKSMDLMDKVLMFMVLQPELQLPPEDDAKRVPGVIYTDMVDLMDKVFIFQFGMGGIKDLEQFRQEFGETLGSMEAVAGVSRSGK